MSRYTRTTRPRTKVYDTNYNIGESYYKSALDGIDRKYGRLGGSGSSANGDLFGGLGQPFPERPQDSSFPRGGLKEMEDFFDDKKKRSSALFDEFDEVLGGRMNNGMPKARTPMRGNRSLEDEIEEDMASTMKKLKAVKISRSMADEFKEETASRGNESRLKSKLDFSDKLMDSVGLTGKARAALEEESMAGKKRFLKMTTESGEGDEMTKWTALKPALPRRHLLPEDDEMSTTGAAARALKSRARLDDLESEMQALSERSAAREKRVRDLKALVQENEANALDNLQTTVKVKASIQSEKKVTF